MEPPCEAARWGAPQLATGHRLGQTDVDEVVGEKHLARFEQLGIYAATVLNASSVGASFGESKRLGIAIRRVRHACKRRGVNGHGRASQRSIERNLEFP